MPAKVYYESDAGLDALQGKTVAVIGYGSQGHAHALNLRDSGIDVVVGLHEGSTSRAKAGAEGLRVRSVADAVREADVIMVLVPDHIQKRLYEEEIAPNLAPGKTLMFAHGFNIHFGAITPPDGIDVAMIAPKSPGHRLRELFQEGVGVPALLPFTRTPRAGPRIRRWPTQEGLDHCGRAYWARRSKRRLRPTCSGSRRSSAVVRAISSKPDSTPWSKLGINLRSLTSNACTSSSSLSTSSMKAAWSICATRSATPRNSETITRGRK
jgi:hypothetical protein